MPEGTMPGTSGAALPVHPEAVPPASPARPSGSRERRGTDGDPERIAASGSPSFAGITEIAQTKE
ncbi:hypothetical protein GCM10027160_39130 [Streptomyces calidiresistens]